jgi:hypothetical protein
MSTYKKITRGWITGAMPYMRPVDSKKANTFRIMMIVRYVTDRLSNPMIRVPFGFESDLNSIPRFLPLGLHSNAASGAAVVHDFIYREPLHRDSEMTRKIADLIYRDAMLDNNVGRVTAYTYYSFVRVFGWRHYANA